MKIVSTTSHDRTTRFEFDNGLVLLIRPNHSLPIIAMRGSFTAGAANEPPEKSGLTKILARLLKSGTQKRTAMQLAQEADFLGSSVQFSPSHDTLSFSLTSLSEHFTSTLGLLTDMLWRSTFPETELERARRLSLSDLKQKFDQPGLLAWDLFCENIFGNHSYRLPLDGYETTLASIKREDVVSFYESSFSPQNLILTIVGDFEPKQMVQLITLEFNSDRKSLRHLAQEVPAYSGKRVVVLEKDLTQANICLGNISCKRDVPEYYASVIMNYILGGSGLTSRLTHRVRTQQGLAYSVYSSMTRRKLGGVFSVRLQTKTESASNAVGHILDEIKRIQSGPVSDEELKDAKNFFEGSFPFRIEANHDYAYYLEQSELYQLGLDYLDKEIDAVKGLSAGEVQIAAKKFLNTENYVLAVVAPREDLGDSLSAWGR